MKKTLSVIICVVLAACMLFGCVSKEETTVATEAPQATEEAEQEKAEATEATKAEETAAPEATEAEATEAEETEAPEESEAQAATPYVDVAFDGDTVKDAAGHAELTILGAGKIGTYDVKLGDTEYTVTGFRGENQMEGITCKLPECNDYETLGDFVLGGASFEIFVQIDKEISANGSLFANSNGGGFNLMLRGANSQIQMNIGIDNTELAEFGGSGYAYAQDPNGEASETVNAVVGELMHIVGVYDFDNDKIVVYLNGEKIAEAEYGGQYSQGMASCDTVGIGYNCGYSESLGALTPFVIARARIYNKSLTAGEVQAAYQESLALLTAK